MTVQALPWAIQGQTHPAENTRNLIAAMFGAPVAALVEGVSITTAGGAHGVVGSGDLAVTQNGTPNMSVNVAAGRAIIRSTETASLLGGAYSVLNDATVNVTIAASDATNPRIDLIIAQVRDSNYSGANTDARLAAVTGTPAGSPAVPAVPDSCVVLAQIAVAALSTTVVNANITDKRSRACALGGQAVCTSATRPSGVSLTNGLRIYETDTFRELLYDGTGFVIMSEPLQAWTPTIGGITVGTGTKTGGYRRGDGWIDIIGGFTHASGSAVTGDLSFTLPINSSANLNAASFKAHMGGVTGESPGITVQSAVGTVLIRAIATAGAYAAQAVCSATIPFTWATGDKILFVGRYPMTTRYS